MPVRWRGCSRLRIRRHQSRTEECCSAGWPTMPRARWWCPRVARWDWPLPMSPIWPPRRCGGLVRSAQAETRPDRTDRRGRGGGCGGAGCRGRTTTTGTRRRCACGTTGPGPAAAGPARGESAWRLATGGGGTLDDLVIEPLPAGTKHRCRNQVRVAVSAVGELPGCGGGVGNVSRPGAGARWKAPAS